MSLDDDLNQVNSIVETHHFQSEDELVALLKSIQTRLVKSHQDHYQPIIKNLQRQISL